MLLDREGSTSVGVLEPFATGALVGRYFIRARVGTGGMGEVYEGFDPDLDRRIAIKLVHTRTAGDPDEQRNLVAEANALAQQAGSMVLAVIIFPLVLRITAIGGPTASTHAPCHGHLGRDDRSRG